jgi:predicted esterase YcpF (UPF0227 family)
MAGPQVLVTEEQARDPAPAPCTHLLYLHGFRSSPQSFKARRLHAWLQAHRPGVHWWCPQLPPSPREAMALVRQGIQGWPAERSAVLGSSLGGFYATVVAEDPGRERWRAVLMNPAVHPARDLAAYIGELTAFHDPQQHFFFRAEFVDELRALAVAQPSHRARYLPIIAKGDELLSWQEMVAQHPGPPLRLVEGSDHALSDFDEHLLHLLHFLGL